MKLSTAMAETALREAHVVAGEHGLLDSEIRWVHVVDHPNVVQWVQSGDLLLTTGFSWPDDADGSRALIEALQGSGLAGVVMAVPHFKAHFPVAAIEAANRVGLPLLELPWEVPFSEVMQEILAKIINLQSALIERSELIHRELTYAAVGAASLSDIADALTSMLELRATFTDPSGNVLARSSGNGPYLDASDAFADALASGHTANQPVGKRAEGARIITSMDRSKTAKMMLPVQARDEIVALLWLDLDLARPSELDRRAMEHASVVAALHIMHQRDLSQQEARLGYALVESLLDGHFVSSVGALERAGVLGWSEAQHYRACLILLDEPVPLSQAGFERRERGITLLKRVLEAAGMPRLIAVTLNQIRFLLPESVDPQRIWEALGEKRAAMASSRVHRGIDGMRLGARDVTMLTSKLRPGRLHRFDEVILPLAVNGDTQAQAVLLDRLIMPLLAKPGGRGEAEGGRLLETLQALAGVGFQLSKAAQALSIHISTLRYRVDRIEHILGLSLNDAQSRFALQFAVMLYELRNEDASGAGGA